MTSFFIGKFTNYILLNTYSVFLIFLTFIQPDVFCQRAEKIPLDSAVNNLAALPFVFPQEKIYVQTDKPYYISGEKIFFRVYLLDASLHHPVSLSRYIYVELIKQESDSACIRVQIRPENNVFAGYLPLPEDLEQGYYRLRAYTRYMTNLSEDFFFTRPVYIADPRHDKTKEKNKSTSSATQKFDVSFYPEGGHLIGGKASAVAFKALNAAGESISVSGELYDSHDNLISAFSTSHDGMGLIYFLPQTGERYYAQCYYNDRQIKVNLPEVKNNTASLKTSWRGNKLWISANKADGFTPPRFYLVIHTRGELIYSGEWDWEKNALVVDKKELPSGISHILLLTENCQAVSERLVFALNDDQAAASITSDKSSYATREKVRIDFALSNLPADSLSGNFAVSVFDDGDMRPDTALNILSTILLTSDLKGSVHHPAFYLKKGDKASEKAADLLMMTHGWTRYDVPKTLRGDFSYPAILPEQSQTVSGTVKSGLLSKPYADAKLTIASSDGTFFEMTEVDKFGKFAYRMELPDSTVYLLKALNKKEEKGTIELHLDEVDYPRINLETMVLSGLPQEDAVLEDIQDYVTKADAKYVQENGMRQVDLHEVVVTGKRLEDKYGSTYSNPEFDFRLTEEDIDKMNITSMVGLLSNLQWVRYTGDYISVQSPGDNNGAMPLILIDDMPVDLDDLKMLNVHDIGQISIIRGARGAIFGINGMYGTIEIYTKRGHLQLDHKPIYHVKKLSPLGYQKPVEFYAPQYDTAAAKANAMPDLRSVIYWKPDVMIDSQGKASFEFYTADAPSTYTIVIEGVTGDGRLIHLQEERFISVE